MLTRRQLLQRGAAGGAGLMLPAALLRSDVAVAAPPTMQLKAYGQPLQVPPVAKAGLFAPPGAAYSLDQVATTKVLHPSLAANGTKVWSYKGAIAADGPAIGNPAGGYAGYLGPTVVVQKGSGLDFSFTNQLGMTSYPGWVPVDTNFTPGNEDEIRPMTHLHGGFVQGQFDGNPALDRGYGAGETQRLWYPNTQRATLLWYHDHGHGTTRLNVFAGLAGGYVIRDAYDTGTADNANKLPVGYGTGPGNYEVPLVVQDRQFSNTAIAGGPGVGDWLYPRTPLVVGAAGSFGMCGNAPNQYGTAPGPWIGEYFGDEMLVNGMVAPVLNVEPRVYRLRVINGCNARFLDLALASVVLMGGRTAPPSMVQIGAEQGLFANAVKVTNILMGPAERADILIDFRGYAGSKLLLKNTPLPNPYASPAARLGDVIQINVGTTVSDNTNNTMLAPGAPIAGGENPQHADSTAPGYLPVPNPGTARTIMLNEWNAGLLHWYLTLTGSGGGPNDVNVAQSGFGLAPNGTPGQGGNCFDDAIGELPPKGETQDWDFVNVTADTHPMHMHLVQFQVVHRRPNGMSAAGVADGTGVLAFEKGWKDTVSAHPGLTTRIRMKFDEAPAVPTDPITGSAVVPNPAGLVQAGTSPAFNLQGTDYERTYVYHCHIVEHEDNDMMRAFKVT